METWFKFWRLDNNVNLENQEDAYGALRAQQSRLQQGL